MKKLFASLLAWVLLCLPALALAGVLIDFESGGTTSPSGTSTFTVVSAGNLLDPETRTRWDVSAGDTVLENVDIHGDTCAFQIEEVTFPAGLTGDNSGTTFQLRARTFLINNALSRTTAEVTVFWSGATPFSGNTPYAVPIDPPTAFNCMQLEMVSGITPTLNVKGRLLVTKRGR